MRPQYATETKVCQEIEGFVGEVMIEVINRERITQAYNLIRPNIRMTPVVDIRGEDCGLDPATIVLKLELLQHTGSFKTRGAFANLQMRDVPPSGVVAASGGNHGAAVAYAAMKRGIRAKIFVPIISSQAKVQRIREYGADLVVEGASYSDAFAASESWARHSGAMQVHAFDQSETMLGQGTIGLELEQQAPDLDTVLVSVGGGGLIAGVAAWYGGKIAVLGVEPERSPTLSNALQAGRPIDSEIGGIAADSLAPRQIGKQVFPLTQRYVERVILVSDEDIQEAQKALWSLLRIVAEPGGATAFAALLSGRYRPRSTERLGILISGGNTIAVNFADPLVVGTTSSAQAGRRRSQ
jgi:threonine dehydratase